MNTYQTTQLSSHTLADPIPVSEIHYFRERLKYRLYDLIISKLQEKQKEDPSFTQKVLADRINKKSAQVCRWLSAPGNWTLDTVSDLLLGIDGFEMKMDAQKPLSEPALNSHAPDWLYEDTNKDARLQPSLSVGTIPAKYVNTVPCNTTLFSVTVIQAKMSAYHD